MRAARQSVAGLVLLDHLVRVARSMARRRVDAYHGGRRDVRPEARREVLVRRNDVLLAAAFGAALFSTTSALGGDACAAEPADCGIEEVVELEPGQGLPAAAWYGDEPARQGSEP